MEGITRTQCLTLEFVELGGVLPWLKGVGATFPMPGRLRVYPHERRTVFEKYPDSNHRGVFEGDGSASIEVTSDAEPRSRGGDHRATFGLFSRNRRWQPVDALYFFGYAVLHYHSLPFTLTEAELRSGHTRARPPTPELASYCFARSPASSFFRGVFENVVCQHSTLSPLSISSWKVSGDDSGSTGVASIAPPALT